MSPSAKAGLLCSTASSAKADSSVFSPITEKSKQATDVKQDFNGAQHPLAIMSNFNTDWQPKSQKSLVSAGLVDVSEYNIFLNMDPFCASSFSDCKALKISN
ncbi:hypothetical protein ACSQ67_014700 [Phaseolus vulgaris]